MNKENKIKFEIRATAFRAWDGTKMVPVNSLCWNAMGSLWYGPGNQFGWAHVNSSFNGWTADNPKPSENDIYPVTQWTGQKDKNGKDIFDGDIIKDELNINMNKFQYVTFIHNMWAVNDTKYFAPLSRNEYIEVVGNIFENPEFLEETK